MNQSVFTKMVEEEFQLHAWNSLPLFQIIIIVTLSVAALLVNMNILYLLFWLPRRRIKRPSNILTGHLSIVLIFSTCIMLWDFGVRINVLESRSRSCKLQALVTNTFKYVFSLNIICLTYERMNTIKVTFGKFHVFRSIFWIWISGIVAAVPTVLQIELGESATWSGYRKCKLVVLHESLLKDELLNVGTFLVFHLLPIAYMICVLYQLSARTDLLFCLKPIPKPSIRKRIQSLRFVCINSTVFIFVWLPLGGVNFITKAMSFDDPPLLKTGVHVVHLLYFIFNPLLHLFLNEDLAQLPTFFGGNQFCREIVETQLVQIEEPFQDTSGRNEFLYKSRGIEEFLKELESHSPLGICECSKEYNPQSGSVAPPPSPQTVMEIFPIRNFVVADVTVHQLDTSAEITQEENIKLSEYPFCSSHASSNQFFSSMILDKRFKHKHIHKNQVPRLSKQTDIVLMPCKPLFEKRKSSDFPYPLEDLSYYALNPFALILIIDNCLKKDHPLQSKLAKKFKDVLNIPATKVLVSFSSTKQPWEFTAEVICGNHAYCNSDTSRSPLQDVIPGMLSPLEFHKSRFRISFGVTVSMSVGTKFQYSTKKLMEGEQYCGKSLHPSNYNCDGNIMTLLEITRVHNFTLNPASSNPNIHSQYITARDIYRNYNYIRFFKRNGFHYHSFQTHTMLYCYTRNETMKLKYVWQNNFRWNHLSVLGIISGLLTLFILFSEDKIKSGLERVARIILKTCLIAFGQRPFEKRRLCRTVAILLLGMTLFAHYWARKAIGGFDSKVTSRVEEKHTEYFQTLKDLVDNGYRIEADKLQQTDLFEEDFYKVGIKNVSNVDWHHTFKQGEYSSEVRAEIVKGKKYAMSVETVDMQEEVATLSLEARVKNRGVMCHGLPQKVGLQLYLWELYTVNRYWVMETIHYLQGSGLLTYWNSNAEVALAQITNKLKA
ncbi:unnamed protein product [Orchesella dallaii]|uniref:G-protein coupled receptors family 1 profile domain-containing protein n=1 Tax=Orchesella dallaii TaxID=48710 RepID=A0ABP1R6W1_9HEXA